MEGQGMGCFLALVISAVLSAQLCVVVTLRTRLRPKPRRTIATALLLQLTTLPQAPAFCDKPLADVALHSMCVSWERTIM
jgi:hypothetical protein